MEAAPGFEPGVKLLQSLALPLGYAADIFTISKLFSILATLASQI